MDLGDARSMCTRARAPFSPRQEPEEKESKAGDEDVEEAAKASSGEGADEAKEEEAPATARVRQYNRFEHVSRSLLKNREVFDESLQLETNFESSRTSIARVRGAFPRRLLDRFPK